MRKRVGFIAGQKLSSGNGNNYTQNSEIIPASDIFFITLESLFTTSLKLIQKRIDNIKNSITKNAAGQSI